MKKSAEEKYQDLYRAAGVIQGLLELHVQYRERQVENLKKITDQVEGEKKLLEALAADFKEAMADVERA